MPPSDEATLLLDEAGRGDAEAAQRLLPLVYTELRSLAASYLRGERRDHTLQPTAVVNEAFVRLIDQTGMPWKNRAHFFAIAAVAMRNILTDHARRRGAEKRGGGLERVHLDEAANVMDTAGVDVVALDEALTELATLDARRHRIVELRFFGGLAMDEIAELLGVSLTTVENEWRGARAWLAVRLGD